MSQLSQSRVMEVLGEVMETPQAERSELLEMLCGDNVILRNEVERLLGLEHQAALALPDQLDASQLLGDLSRFRVELEPQALTAKIAPGTTIGAFRFDDVLGRGGMGVVYRAMDTRLERPVAIKTLPPSLAADTSRLTRFVREAKLLGSLSHPNVATVFGLEETGDAKYLVMELVAGETLTARLARGSMSIAESLSTAAQIAAGLSCAHDAGVIHRDLKPGNVMIAPGEKVKLLDFGLAREVRRPLVNEDSHGHLESDVAITREGSVIGTPRYMSPEQVRGKPVDRRTDVFSFGCVLYEMLAGQPAFKGTDPMEIAVAVLEREPDFSALPSRTPTGVRRLLRRMLAKDAGQRLRDLGDVQLELAEAVEERQWLLDRVESRGRLGPTRRRALLIVLPLLLGVIGAIAWAMWHGVEGPVASQGDVERFALAFPNQFEQPDLARIRVAISRNGKQMVVSASDGKQLQLWRRARGETGFSPIADTTSAWIPILSPDGQWVAYYQNGYLMKRRVAGGIATRVADKATYAGRFHWGADDVFAYVPLWSRGVAIISSAQGGKPVYVTEPDYRNYEFAHVSPTLTPGNRGVLFTIWDGKQGTSIDAVNLDGSGRHNVVQSGECPQVVNTPRGHYLLYAHGGTIFAAPFDLDRLVCSGPAVAIIDGVLSNRPLFEPCYDVADDGTLVYVPGPQFTEQSRLAWLEPNGTTTPLGDDRRPFAGPTFCADGSKLSVIIKGEVYRPYIGRLEQGTFDPAVPDNDTESAAISPDGLFLAYSNNREGPYSLWLRDLTTGTDRKLLEGNTEYQMQLAWSPDSRYLAFSMAADLRSSRDIWLVEVATDEVTCLVERGGEQRGPQFSPDGRWIAYSDDESGVREIRLSRMPDGSVDRQITNGGGDWAQWSPVGDQLYFCHEGKLWAVPVSLEDGSTTGRPKVAYDQDFGQSDFEQSDYTVAPDGRILLIEPSERGPRVSAVHVVLHWYELLDR